MIEKKHLLHKNLEGVVPIEWKALDWHIDQKKVLVELERDDFENWSWSKLNAFIGFPGN